MKCKHCDGVGFFENGASQSKCVYCDGTGEVDVTNEEWIHTLNAEQLAEFLYDITGYEGICSVCEECTLSQHQGCRYSDGVDGWVEWLKQPHTSKE